MNWNGEVTDLVTTSTHNLKYSFSILPFISHVSFFSSALLDLVGLVVPEPGVLPGAVLIASGRRHPSVTLPDLLLVLVVGLAPAAKEEGRLDPGTADLHPRGVRVGHELGCQRRALVQRTLASAIPKNRLALDVDLLVDVQLLLLQHQRRGGGGNEKEHRELLGELHCRRG